jgi:hypothetical protein
MSLDLTANPSRSAMSSETKHILERTERVCSSLLCVKRAEEMKCKRTILLVASTHAQTHKQTDRHRQRNTNTQTDRHTRTNTHTHTHTHRHTHFLLRFASKTPFVSHKRSPRSHNGNMTHDEREKIWKEAFLSLSNRPSDGLRRSVSVACTHQFEPGWASHTVRPVTSAGALYLKRR